MNILCSACALTARSRAPIDEPSSVLMRDSVSSMHCSALSFCEMEMMRATIDATQSNVTGDVKLKLYKGGVHVLGRRSPVSLYSEELSTFEEDGGRYDQADATGFIHLQGLRLNR